VHKGPALLSAQGCCAAVGMNQPVGNCYARGARLMITKACGYLFIVSFYTLIMKKVCYLCCARLVRTNLTEADVAPVKESLAQSMFDHIPVSAWPRVGLVLVVHDQECLVLMVPDKAMHG